MRRQSDDLAGQRQAALEELEGVRAALAGLKMKKSEAESETKEAQMELQRVVGELVALHQVGVSGKGWTGC